MLDPSSYDPSAAAPPAPRTTLAAPLADELAALARAAYPGEACALLIGHRSASGLAVRRLVSARNLAAGDRDDRYQLDPDAYVLADLAARRSGLDVVGIWHTHPDCPPVPSATDREAAWPEWIYLIQTITAAGPGALRAWELVGNRFVEHRLHEE
jgi:proteasome lid subunit RPN8/RPN11